jgi:Rhs element Vgr protein
MGQPVIFKGIVRGQHLELDTLQCQLVIDIDDKVILLNGGRQTKIFKELKDSDILSKLISTVGLAKGKFEATKQTHEQMVQYNCTDWDFLVSRAEANGMIVTAGLGKVNVFKPNEQSNPVRTFHYGIDELYEVEIRSDAGQQFKKINAVGWDTKGQKNLVVKPTQTVKANFGNVKPASTKDLYQEQQLLYSGVQSTQEELEAWGNAYAMRSGLGFIQGRISVPGLIDIHPGDVIEIKGFGPRYDGKPMVSGIRHRVNDGEWLTDLQLGFSARPFCLEHHIMAPPAAGLLPGISGLHIGVVIDFKEDPKKEFRVCVHLNAYTPEQKESIWARLSVPDGGSKHGWMFYPEPGDEVIVGFLNDDPRQAIILGALYGSKQTPPAGLDKPEKENAKKGIITKSGHSILFDDKEQILTFSTSENQQIIIDEKNKQIDIKDANKNIITMNKDGVVIKSDKALTFEASGNKLVINDKGVEFKSSGKMTLEASSAMEIKGATIELK